MTVYVNAVMYYRVADAESAVNNVDDYAESAKLIASTTLRNVLGTKSLEVGNINNEIKNSTNYLAPDGVKEIERKNAVKDLGVMVDESLMYKVHRQKAAKKVVQKLGWVRRTFATRTIPFLNHCILHRVKEKFWFGLNRTLKISEWSLALGYMFTSGH